MKRTIVFILVFLTVISIANQVMAFGLDTIIKGADNFIQAGDINGTINQNNLKKTSDSIYKILLIIGIIVTVIAAIIIGMQFVTGSVEAKAQIKEKLIPYIWGTAIIFGAFTIWKILVDILQGINW